MGVADQHEFKKHGLQASRGAGGSGGVSISASRSEVFVGLLRAIVGLQGVIVGLQGVMVGLQEVIVG